MTEHRLRAVVVIPARGGSKGLPRKNLAPVAGVPLVTRAVEASIGAELVDSVVVSTDDDDIAAVAASHGATVVRRPPDLAGDEATSESAVLHALETLELVPPVTVLVQCTSPFIQPEDIDGCIRPVLDGTASCCFTATEFHGFLWAPSESGIIGTNHDSAERQRRQDRSPELLETGAAYAFETPGFLAFGHRFFGRVASHVIERERSIEIDDGDDLRLANALARSRRASARLPFTPRAIAFDFDGVFTDNRVFVDTDGRELVACDRSDGLGIAMLRRRGIPMTVLSTESNPVVTARCGKLALPVQQGLEDKGAVLLTWLESQDVSPSHALYIGNDANDVECLRSVGWSLVPADAHAAAREVAHQVLENPGGRGAVREVADLVLEALDGLGGDS